MSAASTPSDPASLPLEAVRQVVRLLAEVAVLPGSLADKRQFLLDGLGRLIGVDAWIWGVSQHSESGEQPEYACINKHGFSDEQFAAALAANEHPDMKVLCAPLFAEFGANPRRLTRRREQIIPDSVYASFSPTCGSGALKGLADGAKVGSVDRSQGQETSLDGFLLSSSACEFGTQGIVFILDRMRFRVRHTSLLALQLPSAYFSISPCFTTTRPPKPLYPLGSLSKPRQEALMSPAAILLLAFYLSLAGS